MVYSKCCNCRVIVWLAVYTSSQASRYCVFSMLVLQKRWEAWCYSEKWRRLGIGRSGLGPDSMTNHVTQGESLRLSGRQSPHYCPRGPDRRPVKCLVLIFSDPTCRLSDLPFSLYYVLLLLVCGLEVSSLMRALWLITTLEHFFSWLVRYLVLRITVVLCFR